MNKQLYLYDDVTQDQLEALKDEVRDFMVLSTQDIKNNEVLKNDDGTVLVKEGTLLHCTHYGESKNDLKKMESISVNGIITKEFFGAKDEGRTNYHAEFYRANHDMTLEEFVNDERELFPKEDNQIVAFLVNEGPMLSEVFKNNSLDKNSNTIEEIRLLIKGAIRYHIDEIKEKTMAAIPIGVPANCFSALIVSKDIEKDKEKMQKLHELFSNLDIISIHGKILVEKEKIEEPSSNK